MGGYCEVDDCFRPAAKGRRLCWCHMKNKTRQVPLFADTPDRRKPWDLFVDAVIEFADAPSDDAEEFHRRKVNLRKTAKAWAATVDATSEREVA